MRSEESAGRSHHAVYSQNHCCDADAVLLRGLRPSVEIRGALLAPFRHHGVPVCRFPALAAHGESRLLPKPRRVAVATIALRAVYREKKASMDELWRAAKVCRVVNVMRPYMGLWFEQSYSDQYRRIRETAPSQSSRGQERGLQSSSDQIRARERKAALDELELMERGTLTPVRVKPVVKMLSLKTDQPGEVAGYFYGPH